MTDHSMIIKPIAYIHTDFTQKFGIPRQSGLVPCLCGSIIFEAEYRTEEALRELEGFSHLWLIWGFSAAADQGWHPTVRPPRLGGNKRVGVFASRSPFRPNSLGLSCVKLEKIDHNCSESPVITVSGIDMLDGTPIYDIKPYIPVADCRPEASEGYTAYTKKHLLEVLFTPGSEPELSEEKAKGLKGLLSSDPRPGYDDSPDKEYGVSYAGYNIVFKVNDNVLTVVRSE